MKTLKIAFVSSEVSPFAKTGGLADVSFSLPLALKSLGCEVKIFMPFYRSIKNGNFGIETVKYNLTTKQGDGDAHFSLHQAKRQGLDIYFIEKDEYFNRDNLYGDSRGDYGDNMIRFAFFSNAVLSSIKLLNFSPDVIHCNEWQTALIPFYLKFNFSEELIFKGVRTLFTIHNLAYQGVFDKDALAKIGIKNDFFRPEALEFYGRVSFIKSGIVYSDCLNTVSKAYSREILTKEYGHRLEGLLNLRKDDLFGIINGVDYSEWSPENDKFIKQVYSKDTLENKLICKEDLIKEMNLKASVDTPLLGVVSRLAEQKGIDLIVGAVDELIRLGFKLVILGKGEEKYQNILLDLAARQKDNIAVRIDFNNALAHKIEAGCDMFLMPSRYEPCGLNQMYSLKYGTIPIVRATGGLDDTIIDYSHDKIDGNGFKFRDVNSGALLDAIKRAFAVFKNKNEWKDLVIRAMECDYSWGYSAREYLKLYNYIKDVK